eukprot:gene1705-1863_t
MAGFAAGLTIACTVPFYVEHTLTQNNNNYPEERILQPVVLFEDILQDLDENYVDKVDTIELFKTAMKAMLASLDPYTEFQDLQAAQSMQESVQGKYAGVGMIIGSQEGGKGVKVVDTFEGYSYNAGLRPGDRLLSVDGQEVGQLSVDKVRDLLRGSPASVAEIRFLRPGEGEKTIQVRRSLVRVSDIRCATLLGAPESAIGYISLSGFNAGSAEDFREALTMLRYSTAGDLKGLVVDLRGNSGGLLDQAVSIASYLVPQGSEIVTSRSKDGVEEVYRSISAPLLNGVPLALLVNQNTASAAEILAGAVQDLDAGVVLGTTSTFGKGLVQKIVPLPYDSALKYTIARYYTPSGRCIQKIDYNGGRLNRANSDAQIVPEQQRQTFYTLRLHRPVRDGGGIEPDLPVDPLPDGGIAWRELVLNSGLLADFSEEFLANIQPNLRSQLREAAGRERLARNHDVRYRNAYWGKTLGQAYVQNHDIRSENERMKDPELRRAYSIESFPLSTTMTSSEEAIDLRSASFDAQQHVDLNPEWTTFLTQKPLGEPVGLASQVSEQFFWGRNSARARKELFPEFLQFLQARIKSGNVDLLSLSSYRALDDLQKTLEKENNHDYTLLIQQLDRDKAALVQDLIADISYHRKVVEADLELAVLSKELPDRLLIYRSVIADPQINTAAQLLRGESVKSSSEKPVTYFDFLSGNE